MYIVQKELQWSWSYGSWISNYLCNQCLSPLICWVRIPLMARFTRYNIVINFVSDLRQVGGFLQVVRFPPPIILTVHDMTESGVKHHNPNTRYAGSKFNRWQHNNTVNNFNIHAFSLQVHMKLLAVDDHLLWIGVVHLAHWWIIWYALHHQLLTSVSMEAMKIHNTNDNISLNETILYTVDSNRNSYISFFSRHWS